MRSSLSPTRPGLELDQVGDCVLDLRAGGTDHQGAGARVEMLDGWAYFHDT
jgi:hypothetical protein